MAMGAIYPDLKAKHVLITGGGSGIGEAIVRSFCRQGSRVSFIDIKAGNLQRLAEELLRAGASIHFEQADLTDIGACAPPSQAYARSMARCRFSSTMPPMTSATQRWT